VDEDIQKEQEEFCEQLEKVASSLAYIINTKLNGTNAVDDIYQETILSAWVNRNTLQDKANFKSWIFQIARNKCNDYYRKTYKLEENSCAELKIEIAVNRYGKRDMIADQQKMKLEAAIERLKPEDKEILSLVYYKGLTVTQLSEKLSIPLGTAKRRLFDVRNRLKRIVEERMDLDE
jgi:RNA polymerase sigma-70 factor, ECF subfamily